MENIASSTIELLAANNSFWHDMPAAAYVLLGVIISGLFTIISNILDIFNSRKLKKLENKNSRELKELEIVHAEKIRELEIVHAEKIQSQDQTAKKALRLLDDKVKIFSDFYSGYSEILISGTNTERHERIENLRRITYKVMLLAPSQEADLEKLSSALNHFANFYLHIITGEKSYSAKEEDAEIDTYLGKIRPMMVTIFPKLVEEM